MNWLLRLMLMQNMLLDEKDENGKGGGGGGGNEPDLKAELAAQKEANAALLKRFEEFEKKMAGGTPPKKEDDPDLADKARKEREAAEKKTAESKSMESALSFNLQTKDFLKNNATLLPKSIEGILAQAEKETYDSALDKSAAIKVGIVSEYFAQQDNLDLLTASQKSSLEEFLKLSKTVKQERVNGIYDSIFEPTLESARRIKKAKAVQQGLADPSDNEDAYKKRMMELSRKHYLGEKKNA